MTFNEVLDDFVTFWAKREFGCDLEGCKARARATTTAAAAAIVLYSTPPQALTGHHTST